jgi:hypothetical protein
MDDTTKYKLIFNGAGALVALTVAGYFVTRAISPDSARPCSETYSVAMPLSLETSNGVYLTPIELEARIRGRASNVADFAKVVPGGNKAVPVALEVSLPKGSIAPSERSNTSGGIGFDWQPTSLASNNSVCLSYRVFFPADFDFKRGGTLPGLYGTAASDVGGTPAFSTNVMWRDRGEGEIHAMLPTNKDKRGISLDRGSFKLPRGAWVRIDQEVALNTPGQKDGQLRLWVDGSLMIDKRSITFRNKSDVTLAGGRIDLHYGGTDASYASPKDTTVRLSAPVLRTN